MRRTIVLALLVWLAGIAAAAAQEPEQTANGHLRVQGAGLKKLIDTALEVSTTFREIARDLERSSVIVYVRYGRCRAVSACTEFINAAPPYIYLRATVDQFEKSPWKVTGLLAHELQHARELSGAPIASVTDFVAFYQAHGRRHAGGFETAAAAAIGDRVEREMLAKRIAVWQGRDGSEY
ncbi:MAG TPA: hypothetical protein VF491_09870 [Vicinamibacterales bacterium]